MRLLLDTQAFLYFIIGNPLLSARARALIEDPHNERLLSIASIWEMAIKTSLGKLVLAQPLEQLILRETEMNAISVLPVTIPHAAAVTTLPLHHRDPFDRMLIAQGMVEDLPLVSGDAVFDRYPVHRLW